MIISLPRKTGIVLIPTLALALLLSGCTAALKQPNPQVQYYTLEYETAPAAVPARPAIAAVLMVDRLEVAPAYTGNRIIYRDREFRQNAYAYHKWRAAPGELVSHYLVRDLGRSGLFTAVLPSAGGTLKTHVLHGTLEDFLEWDTADSCEARLTLNLTLEKLSETAIASRIIFQERFEARTACRRKEPEAVARALSEAMADISGQVIRKIHSSLKNDQQ